MASINTKLQTSIRNELRLNSQTRLWLNIISMPAIDLKERIEKEMSENPFLEYSKSSSKNNSSLLSSKSDYIENTVSTKSQSLFEHLKEQINIAFESKKDIYIAELVISYINHDGYLTVPASDIADTIGESVEKVSSIINVIKTFDPFGIASKNIQECLSTQLKYVNKPENIKDIAIKIVENYLDKLSKREYSLIAADLNISIGEVKNALKLIQTLEPYPGREYDNTEIKYIIPELFIFKKDGIWEVKTDETFIAPLKISKKYSKLVDSTDDKDTLKYLQDKKRTAESLINAVNERKKTLYKVGLSILRFQLDFFENGKEYMRPLTLSDVANNINLSESTISRISNSKYLQTVWGTFAIKYFFSRAVNSNLGSRAVKEMIKRIAENSDTKLSDEKIRLILKAQGIDIARRTVAKYRKGMNLL